MDTKSPGFKYTIALELLAFLFSVILAFLVLLPLTNKQVDYPFFIENTVFIFTFVLVTRYLFFLKYSFLAKQQVAKVGLVFIFIPFIFYLISSLHGFRTFLDEEGMYVPMQNLPADKGQKLGDYMYYEMVFFGSGAIVASIIFPFRLILSVWTLKNRGKV
ncbi:MAG: hypothetical protein RLZZ417_954 [Bacteroidota bacterium]